ncbi:mannosyltransferase [Mesohalobacter halotolerans]|uniref:Mannosyltransferase n=1 Tax=Mesohalobacter halotolerans TaxID=1883405 RepID=A0A4U5TUE8_9FLAO|nr:mannosyltransferase [Mesohalobacter halotolerans]MBS3737920.1 mannosyltransferase [Psychroflexus sp.]TKS57561.1 mannosyltransferase [Mesohalobacter halotolerans]
MKPVLIFLKPLPYKTSIFVSVLGVLVYGIIAFFTSRTEFTQLILLTAISFIITYIIIEKSELNFNQLCVLSLLYRLVFLVSIPNLSQDFFRFFWDGQLVLQGLSPYAENVNYFFNNGLEYKIDQAEILRQGMGKLNAGNYSNYPAFSQYIYAVCAWFAKGSVLSFVISLRLILICFDLLFIVFAKKLLVHFKQNPKKLFWYVLNPLCILELTGNLHLEGVMIAFFVIAFYLLITQKHVLSALFLSLSISTKLLSLIFLPLVFKYHTNKFNFLNASKRMIYYSFWVILLLGIQFVFFYDDRFFNNFSESIALWFGKFEFNASIFYVIKWIGYQISGWNIIQTYALFMPFLTVISFVIIIIKSKAKLINLLENLMWMFMIYYLLSTTVHPWYILFPLALSVFTPFKAVYLWSFLIFLSYFAYNTNVVVEPAWVLIIEYGILIIYICYELKRKFYSSRIRKILS